MKRTAFIFILWRPIIILILILALSGLAISSCCFIKVPYKIVKGTVKGGYYIVKGAYELTAGTVKVVYKIGGFSFTVVKAPLEWPFAHPEIETIGGLPPKEAVRQGKVKNAPYTVKGKTYYPMSVEKARTYQETGLASWYGNETI